MPTESDPHAALAEARARHAERLAARQAADAAHRLAGEDVQSLLARAGAGESVTTDDIKLAQDHQAETGRAAALAGAIEAASLLTAHRATIAALHATAEGHVAECDGSIGRVIDKGRAVDVAYAALRVAAADYVAAGVELAAVHNRAQVFNSSMAAQASANPVLKAMDAGHWPRANVPARGAPEKITPALLVQGFGELVPATWLSVEGKLRSGYARPVPVAAE